MKEEEKKKISLALCDKTGKVLFVLRDCKNKRMRLECMATSAIKYEENFTSFITQCMCNLLRPS